MKLIGGYVAILLQSTTLVEGRPAFCFNYSTTEVVPTNTDVPVSTIPVFRFHDYPLHETFVTFTTHHAYNITLWY